MEEKASKKPLLDFSGIPIKKVLQIFVAGVVCGVLAFIIYRLVTFTSDAVHYHANFALYVNGVKDEFSDPTFYEEVQSCGGDEQANPKARVHMHDRVNYVVHVHDHAATWGHFFANMGYGLTSDAIITDDGMFTDGQNGSELTFMLNGEAIDSVTNRVINSEDRLLIDYGNNNQSTLKARFNEIPADAGEYNQKSDPSSCSGGQELTFFERLKQVVGIKNR